MHLHPIRILRCVNREVFYLSHVISVITVNMHRFSVGKCVLLIVSMSAISMFVNVSVGCECLVGVP